ncbi:MAG: FAD:protein FMN transferase [Acetobacteraceae bacterium]|nr:FAD:protein FMN transferase [Acetobacteraceae bacterium]
MRAGRALGRPRRPQAEAAQRAAPVLALCLFVAWAAWAGGGCGFRVAARAPAPAEGVPRPARLPGPGCAAPARASGSALLMDTLVRVEAWGPPGSAPRVQAAVSRAIRVMAGLDESLDFYSPGSAVGRLNARSGGGWVEVGPEAYGCLRLALELARFSGGSFDPTVGPLVRLWGFGGRPRVPSAAELRCALELVGFEGLELGPEFQARLVKPGAAVDLGAIAKGYAVDRAAEVLRQGGVSGGLVVAGGCVFALGRREDGRAWRVAVQGPRDPTRALTDIELVDRAVDTSGDYQRWFESGGRRYHHVLDPTTGMPAQGLVSATVVGRRAVEADALATAALVLGPARGLEMLRRRPGVEALLVDEEGRVLCTPGFPGRAPSRCPGVGKA